MSARLRHPRSARNRASGGRQPASRRRVLCGTLAAMLVPCLARAQTAAPQLRLALPSLALPVSDLAEATGQPGYRALHAELRRLGYIEGRNLTVLRHSAHGNAERLAELVQTIVASKPGVIFAGDPRLLLALKAATAAPIVAVTGDPVAGGLVESLERPGGNITGFSVDPGAAVVDRRVALLQEMVPDVSPMAWLGPRAVWESGTGEVMRAAAERAGANLVPALLESPVEPAEYRRVFAALRAGKVRALYVSGVAENVRNRRLIVSLAAAAAIPAMYLQRADVEAGGLMAYAVDVVDLYRRAAGYIDLIARGRSPAELPFQQPAKFDFAINLKTANALDIVVPKSLLGRADYVVE